MKALIALLVVMAGLVALSPAQGSPRPHSYGNFGTNGRHNSVGSDISISAVSVLLPQDPNVLYKLEVFNGCFRWSVMNPDVVDLEFLPEDRECGRRVFVRPSQRYARGSSKVHKIQERERTWVTAEDKQTQRLIRAEIFTDRIARFEVLTTNRDLRKDDIEVIGIQAFDTENNAFSTLDGLEFLWTVAPEPNTGRDASNLLQLLPLKDSHIEASALVLKMEAEGKQSSYILAQARATGKVLVTARLVDSAVAVAPSSTDSPTYDSSTISSTSLSQSVILSILEPLNLVPSAMIYVPPYATVPYVLQTIERESFRNITMPNSDYVWSTSNPAIASVTSSGVVSAHGILGSSYVDVRFTTVDDNYAHGHITVVEPVGLDLQLLPKDSSGVEISPVRAPSTFIIAGIPYTLIPSLYDAEGNRLYTTDNVKFDVQIASDLLLVEDRTSNNNALSVMPQNTGTTTITIEVESIGRGYTEQWQLKKKLEHQERVTIVSPLRVLPAYRQIVLPYHPVSRHTIQLEALGGSGGYVWTTTNRSVSSVTATGLVSGFVPGNDMLRCVDSQLSYNKVDIPIIVAVPTEVSFVKGAREAEVDSQLFLGIHLVGLAPDGSAVTFDNCSALHMSANLSNQEVFGLPTAVPCTNELIEAGACACIQLHAMRVGQASISLLFDAYDPAIGKPEFGGEKKRIAMNAAIVISAFHSVKVTPAQVLLTHSASLDIAIAGGPTTWHTDAPVVPKFDIPDPSKLSIEPVGPVTTTGFWRYRLTCLDYGEQYVRISVGNPISPNNPEPVFYHQSLKYGCLEPHSVILHPHNRAFVRPGGDGVQDLVVAHISARNSICADDPFFAQFDEPNATLPLHPLMTRYKLRIGSTPLFNVSVLDAQQRRFDNFSSLAIDWTISSNLVSFAAPLPGQDMKRDRALIVADEEGSTSIRVAVTGWDASISTHSGLFSRSSLPSLPLDRLVRTYDIDVVKNGVLAPPVLSLYNRPDNKVQIKSLSGSGDAYIRSNGTRAVAVSLDAETSSIFVQPVKNGIARITAVDACLVGSQPAHSFVRVSDVHAIRVIAPTILQLGHEGDIHFEMLDSAGHPFEEDQLKLMDIKLHLEGDAVIVGDFTPESGSTHASDDTASPSSSSTGSQKPSRQPKRVQTVAQVLSEGRTKMRMVGVQLGVTTVSIVMTNVATGNVISSSAVQIQVFPPLQVYPRTLELLPGATFQLEVFGGPPTRTHLSFASSNHSLVSVTPDGVVTAKNFLGYCQITVTAHVPGPHKETIFVENVDVIVKHLHGILIHSSTTRLVVGEEIVVRVVGLENESPFVWSGIDLAFQWEAVNPDVLGLAAIYSPAGISVDDEQGLAVIVKALAPGTTRLSARLVAGPSFLGGKSASLAFEVVPSLSLAEAHQAPSSCPTYFHQRLLLAPHTRHSIRANLGSAGVVTSLLTATDYTALSSSGARPATLQQDAIVQVDTSSEMVLSKGVAGSSVLQLQDKRDGQLLLVHVAVKPIHHIELRARSPIQWEVSVGAHSDFDIVLRDNLGHEFDSYEHTNFEWHFSRHDIVYAELLPAPESSFRKMLRIKGVRPGTTLVQVTIKAGGAAGLAGGALPSTSYASSPFSGLQSASMQHFHMIRVSNAILPLSPVVHVGGSVHFNISFSSSSTAQQQTQLSGRVNAWSSSQPRVLHIDPVTGVATALAPGKATVHYNTTVFTSTLLRSVEVAQVEMDANHCKSLSNIEEPSMCTVALTFRDMDGRELVDSESIQHHIEASCSASHDFIEATFVPSNPAVSGRPTCLFTAKRSENPENIVKNVILSASAFDTKQTYRLTSNLTIPFTSAFFLLGKSFRLTPMSPTADVVVYSSDQVLFRSRDPSKVNVDLIAEPNAEAPTRWHYRISVPANIYPFSVSYVDFFHNTTQQTEFIGVSYSPYDDGGLTEVEDSFFSFWTAVGLGTLTFGLAYIVSVVCSKESS